MFSIVSQAQRVQARLKALAQLNLELAKLEGKRKATALAIAAALVALAAVLVMYAIGFLLASAAVALHSDFALWLALLIVAGAVLVVALIAVFLASRFAKKLSAPSDAVDETERTVQTIKSHA
jgi:ABC-type multidrug transport system fused ATPase/permease subunit